MPEVALVAVSRVYLHVVAQRHDLVEDRTHDPRIVSAGHVGAADRLAEERVAREEDLGGGVVEDHVSGRMSGCGDDVERRLPEGDGVAAVEVDVYCLGHGARMHAEELGPHTGRLEQEAVARGEGEGHAVAAAQELHTHRMVEVPVGVECEYGFEAPLGDEVLEGMVFALVHVAGVDDGGLEGVVPHNVGILLYGVEYHSCYLYHCKVFLGRRMTPVIRVKVSNFARDGPTAADKIGFKVPFCAVPAPTWQANLHLLPRRACFCPCLFVSLSQDRESAAVAVRDIFSRGRRVRHEG